MKKIAIFGDSFVEGVGDDIKGGWALRFQEQISNKFNIHIDGLGGRNILDVKERLLPFLDSNEIFGLILNVGINDSRYRESKSDLEIPKDQFEKEYRGIIEFALAKGVEYVFLLGLSRVDESLVLNYKPDKSHTNANAELLDRVVASLANDDNVIYIPVANIIRADRLPETLYDGLHPNSLGHELIVKALMVSMSNHKII